MTQITLDAKTLHLANVTVHECPGHQSTDWATAAVLVCKEVVKQAAQAAALDAVEPCRFGCCCSKHFKPIQAAVEPVNDHEFWIGVCESLDKGKAMHPVTCGHCGSEGGEIMWHCNNCGNKDQPYTSPPDDLKFRPDWSGVDVLAEELREAQKAMRLALERMQEFALWADSQADAQSKGGHATFDIMELREQRDLTNAAIAALEGSLK